MYYKSRGQNWLILLLITQFIHLPAGLYYAYFNFHEHIFHLIASVIFIIVLFSSISLFQFIYCWSYLFILLAGFKTENLYGRWREIVIVNCERIYDKQRVDWSMDFCFFCYLFSHQWCLCIRRLYVRRLCCVLILKSVLYLFSPECPTSRYSVVHHTRT